MRLFILYSLTFVSVLSFVSCTSTANILSSTTPSIDTVKTIIAAIEIQLGEIQREQKPFTIQNKSNGIATWQWEIIESEKDSVVFRSSDTNPTLTLSRGHYDILITANGIQSLTRHYRRMITVLPDLFTAEEADEIIDFNSMDSSNLIKDYQGITRPGYKILVKGTLNGRLKIMGLRGTRENPVHIINQGQVIINATLDRIPYPVQWSGGNQYILFDGKGDSTIEYGFKITGHPTKPGQCFFIAGPFNKGFEMCGVNIVGRQGLTKGASAIQLQPTYSAECNATNWNFEYFFGHHLKIEEATNEGFYIGYFTDNLQKTGFAAYRLGQVLLYRNSIVNSGWDAIQIASADEFEVHDNAVHFAGLAGNLNHSAFFSWNDGNLKGWCYRNTFKSSAHAVSVWYGRTGREAYIFENLFVEGKYSKAIKTPALFFSKLDAEHMPIALHIFNNTIITKRKPLKVLYRNQTDSTGISITFAGNAIVMGKINERKFPDFDIDYGMRDSANWIIKNNWRLTDKENELQWNSEFHPAQPESPLLLFSFDVRKRFANLKGGFYDHDGYPIPTQNNFGCFSGYEIILNAKQKDNGIH